jgi:C4-dicarboxylate-specific signal transduction histidine kinase
LTTGVNNLQTLSLKYFQNKITIETGVIDYYSKGKNQIRYKLEGLNDAWQYAPAYYTIRFDGLRAANYKLIVQAASPSNEFNGPEKILTIIISPPFWETWWFRVLSVVAMVFVVYAIVQQQSRKLKKRNVMLEEKVVHRTKELKHSLEELRSTQTQLIQQEKMASLGELTAGIAHEIQNPLNFVNNFSDVSKELIEELVEERSKPAGEKDDELESEILNDIKQNLEKINHHGNRAGAIVKAMLEHSKTSKGIKEPTDINKLVDEYLRLSYHGFRAKDKDFDSALHKNFGENIGTINVVPQDIGRVLLNVFNNAFYAVNEKRKSADKDYEPSVSVQTKRIDDKIKVHVRDNGNGIPQNIVDKIFQPFFTTKPTGQGTGLGLSLAYDIIKAHGGEIKVETKEGEGTSFKIILSS